MNPPPLPTVVLDTNVVLDWLFFADPRACPIANRIESRRVRWVATGAMRDELADVLGRDPLRRRRPDGTRLLLPRFDALADLLPDEPASPRLPALRCRDPADQKFVDLAVGAGAHWLLTRDRALLDLRRAAAPFGVQILAPVAWAAAHAFEPDEVFGTQPAWRFDADLPLQQNGAAEAAPCTTDAGAGLLAGLARGRRLRRQ